jgi:serine/threonine-protein kinase
MSATDQSSGSASLPPPGPTSGIERGIDDATVISRGESFASWSGTATGPIAGGPATTGEIGRVLEGTMLGPYRLDQFVGGGGMGAVFRALDTTLDRTVAVKVLAGRQADDEEMLKRFRNEAQSAARLDHENIGRVHAVGSENGWHFIVFEFIEGTNLRDLVRADGPFDLARTVDVAMQVADALEHASERDVVHRDIKPSNIVITPAGRARIVDMGLARLPQVAEDRDLTVSGMTLGTFDYISPEQARDPRAADVRSDLYSLGCTIFFMLAGRPPFADGTMVQKLLQHQQQAPPSLDDIRPDVPTRFAEIVSRLMAKDPLDRYQRPAVLVADLAAFAEEEGLHIVAARSVGAPVVPFERPSVSPVPWLVSIAGLMLVVAAMWAASVWDRRATVTAPIMRTGDEGAGLVTVVAGSPEPGEAGSLAEAVRRRVGVRRGAPRGPDCDWRAACHSPSSHRHASDCRVCRHPAIGP